jgi:SAM-dependent methyltransferase
LVQDVLSVVPKGEALNYLLQRHVTHGLPAPDGLFRMHVDEAERHLRVLREQGGELGVLYEFGAGWDLIGPLLMAREGIERQILVDIRRNVRMSLVQDTLRRLGMRETTTLEALGIEYLAPRDARDTGLPAHSVDAVTSTFTLEHIPAADIAAILRESRRILRPGGLVSCAVDMKDHYSYFDGRLGPYHFLTVPDNRWRLVNPPLHHQNRLRLSDYRRLFQEAGLTIVDEEVRRPTDAQREALAALELAPRFKGRPLEDLAALEVRLVARSASAS